MLRLKLTRAGTFRCVAPDGHDVTQCGRRGVRELRYRVEIRAKPDQLTPDGFIIDNFRVKDYFDRRWNGVLDLPSCEFIAIAACQELRRLVEDGGAVCEVVRASIGGVAGDAFLTAELTAEDMPENLREAAREYLKLDARYDDLTDEAARAKVALREAVGRWSGRASDDYRYERD